MERKVFGAPRPLWHLDPASVDAPNMFRGSDVEHAVAASLNLLTHEFPGATVFHSASLEEDGHREVDSVVAYKKFVFLIEAKSAAPGTKINFSVAGKLRRSTPRRARTFPYLKNRLDKKVEVFSERFPDLCVRGIYVFSGSAGITVDSHENQFLVPFEGMLPLLRNKMNPARPMKLSPAQAVQVEEMSALLVASQKRDDLTKYARRILLSNPSLALPATEVLSSPTDGFLSKLKATYRIWFSM